MPSATPLSISSATSRRWRSETLSMGVPSIEMMRSSGRAPARAAGEPSRAPRHGTEDRAELTGGPIERVDRLVFEQLTADLRQVGPLRYVLERGVARGQPPVAVRHEHGASDASAKIVPPASPGSATAALGGRVRWASASRRRSLWAAYDAANSSMCAVWPGADASRTSHVISGALIVSAKATKVAS